MKYFWLTLCHKWFVILASRRVGLPLWRALLHDLSKFSWKELPHYQRQFFGPADQPERFAEAWLHHQNCNPHHWEYWIPRTAHSKGSFNPKPNETLTMPDWALREMVVDWMAAGRAYNKKWPDVRKWTWLESNLPKLQVYLNETTLIRLRRILWDLGVCCFSPAWSRPDAEVPQETSGD